MMLSSIAAAVSSYTLLILFLLDSTSAQLNLSLTARWSGNATTVAGFASGVSGSSLLALDTPRGLHVADNDILYIADSNNNRIVVIQPNSTTAMNIIGAGLGSQNTQFSYPTDVFVTGTAIYVTDSSNFRVQKWSRNLSNPITVAGITGIDGTATNNTAILSSPYYIFVDSNENLYVSDTTNNRVLFFPSNSSSGTRGVILAGDGTAGVNATSLSDPFGVFVNQARTLYIADRLNHRIQKWSFGASFGVTVAGTGVAGNSLSQLNNPRTVIVDTNGYMYISDGANSRILRWAPSSNTGECIAACSGAIGTAPDQLGNAYDIAFDSHGSLYVSDRENNRVQKFQIIAAFTQSTNVTQTVTNSTTIKITTTKILTTTASATSLFFSTVHQFCMIGTMIIFSFVVLYRNTFQY